MNFHIVYYPLYMLIMHVYHAFGHMRDSDRKIWLQSYIPTPAALPDSDQHHDSGRASRLWSMSVPHILHLSYERLHMIGLDDCIILQPEHLIRSRLGGTHDSFNTWNPNMTRHWHLTMAKSAWQCRHQHDLIGTSRNGLIVNINIIWLQQ
jgi:hypothetical protein